MKKSTYWGADSLLAGQEILHHMELLSATQLCAEPFTSIPRPYTLIIQYLFQNYPYFHVKESEVATLFEVLP
jgi:hypothetical protein